VAPPYAVPLDIFAGDPIFCEGSLTKRDKDQRFPEADLLSTEDWVVLNQLLVVLEPIKRATKRFEGNWINFPEVL